MKYRIDHDYHIHSQLSSCSSDPLQTTQRILQYAKDNHLSRVCVTDHYWDTAVPGASGWYKPQNFPHIAKSLPLPQADGIDFLFGCETDMDMFGVIGIPAERCADFDFIIVPTTHLHMTDFTIRKEDHDSAARAALWVKRTEHLLNLPLPFHKVGIAHLACSLTDNRSRGDYLATLQLIPEIDMERIFAKAAACGVGIELNQSDMSFADSEADIVLRMFRIAKHCGCKFYLGSDAHHPHSFAQTKSVFERAVTLLDLHESDKFLIGG